MTSSEDIITVLAHLTGTLLPTAKSSAADLGRARRRLAEWLVADMGLPDGTPVPDQVGAALSAGTARVSGEVMDALRAEVAGVVERSAAQTSASPAPWVIRRHSPLICGRLPGSVPAPASELAPSETLGPFVDELGGAVWFDVVELAEFTSVVRGALVELTLPPLTPLEGGGRYAVAAGTVWLNSQRLDANAPPDSLSGIDIVRGELSLSDPAVIVDGRMEIANATVSLSVTLDRPPNDGPIGGPGVDASVAGVDLPTAVTFVCKPSGTDVTQLSDAGLTAYGCAVSLTHSPGPVEYVAELNRILVPLRTDADEFAVTDCRSTLWQLEGRAPVLRAAWALVASTAPTASSVSGVRPKAVGRSRGAGQLVLGLDPGLEAKWLNLSGGRARLGRVFILAAPGQIGVVATKATHRRGEQQLRLWQGARAARHSSISLRYGAMFPLWHTSERSRGEAVWTEASAVANLDRPVQAKGERIAWARTQAAITFVQEPTELTVELRAEPTSQQVPSVPIALRNALFVVRPGDALYLTGDLTPDGSVKAGSLRRMFTSRYAIPMLPDPYVSNLITSPDASREDGARGGQGGQGDELFAVVTWPSPDRPELEFSLRPGEREHLHVPVSSGQRIEHEARPGGAHDAAVAASLPDDAAVDRYGREAQDRDRSGRLESMFAEVTGGRDDSLIMLDVSSNADQFGIGFGMSGRTAGRAAEGQENVAQPELDIVGIDLVSLGRNVRVLTLPAISWEPVFTPPNPSLPFPPVLASADDGGPTRLGVNSMALVPIAPLPALEHLIDAHQDPNDPRPAAALFTLPFGLRAVAQLNAAPSPGPGATLGLVQPEFPDDGVTGARQLSLSADTSADPDQATPGMPGATVQTRNGTTLGGVPLSISVLGGTSNAVETIFNNEFGPGSTTARVPLTRYDISGYGASVFSEWANPGAAVAQTSQVRFDVLVGRTAYEVVQVKSLLYPWGVPVVRTITLERGSGAGVVRADSGWQAAGAGVYQFPVPAGQEAVSVGARHIHPGVVGGVFNVRSIRDTPREFTTNVDGGARLSAVTFDADVRLAGIRRGGAGGFAPTTGQLGFVQLAPTQVPLTRRQLRALLEQEGPLGGPVDCAIDVGESGLIHRVTRVDVGFGLDGSAQPVFVASARGAPLLPRAGSWSVVRTTLATGRTTAVDASGTPIVREGPAMGAPPTGPYRFADPADLLRTNAICDYGLLFATGTQRVLFRRPKVETGQPRVTSTQFPLLADTWSLLRASGVFPNAADCLEIPTAAYSLGIYPDAEGELRLDLPFLDSTFTLDPNIVRVLAQADTTRTYAQYADVTGAPTRVKLTFDSRAPEPWTFRMEPLSLVVSNDGAEVFRFHIPFVATAAEPSRFENPKIILGPPFDAVKAVLKVLEFLGLAPVMALGMSNEWKVKGGFDVKLPEIDLEGAKIVDVGATSEVSFNLGALKETSGPSKKALTESRVSYGVSAGLLINSHFPPELYFGGVLELKIEANPQLMTTIRAVVVMQLGGDLLGGTAQARIGVGLEFGFGGGNYNLYGVLVIKAEIKWFKEGTFKGFVGAEFSFELKGGWVQRTCIGPGGQPATTSYLGGEVAVALEVTVGWVLTISIEFSDDFHTALGPEICPF